MQMPKLLISVEGDIKDSHIVRIIEDGEEQVLKIGGWLGRAIAFHDAFPRLLKLIRSIGQDVTGEVEGIGAHIKAWFKAAPAAAAPTVVPHPAAAEPPAAPATAPNPPAEASSAAPPPDAAAAAPGAGPAP